MRFLTYNLWHGLSPASPLAFEALEPSGRRELREQAQIDLVREINPDVCFFQETNPVSTRAPKFAAELGMDFTYQPDLVGLKLFGLGIPVNLNSGLTVLAKKSFGLKKLEGVSLSRPGSHLVQTWASWQLKEERFAIFAEAMLPKWGRVLLINTHLHHGLEATPDFLEELDKLAEQMEISETVVNEIKRRLAAGSERRHQELGVLLETLKKYEKRYEVVIVGGDFNASPESGVSRDLKDAGFRDSWLEAFPEGGGMSFDSTRNRANHLLQGKFPLTLVVEDLSFSAKVKEALLTLARKQETRPRRIDYIWMRADSVQMKVKRSELVGVPNYEGFAPSDHFGVCTDIELV